MKQSKTVLKELTAAYRAVLRHGILCNAIALGLIAMPAMADVPAPVNGVLEGVLVSGETGQAANGRLYNMAVADSDLSILNSTFTGNIGTIAWATGPNADDKGNSLFVSNSTFSNNTSENNGTIGAGSYADSLTVYTSEFDENTAVHGGAIFTGAKNGTQIDNGTFTSNTATSYGGAIYGTSALTINNSTFDENTAAYGAAIMAFGDLAVKKSDFNNNTGVGIIYVASGASIEDSNFTNNSGTGGVYVGSGDVTISKSTFTSNTAADGYGAAVANAAHTVIKNSTFDKNFGHQGGTVMNFLYDKKNGETVNDVTLDISDSVFTNNITEVQGGAVDTFSIATIKNTTFKNNETTTANNDGGGAMFVGAESITKIVKSVFENNTSASAGGAIMTRSADVANNSAAKLDITESTFKGNKAATTGGALDTYFYNSQEKENQIYIANSTFEKNSATNGGAIFNHGIEDKGGNKADMYLNTVSFTGNTTTENGGAIYNESNIVLSGINRFTGNKAANKANDIHNLGALTIESGTTTIDGGITGDGTLTIADGATLNIGTAQITQDTITLNGTLVADLVADSDSILNATTAFDGNGKLSLAIEKAGTYNLFGGKIFDLAKEQITSTVYDLDWTTNDGKSVVATLKSVDTIANETGMATDTAAAFSHVAQSASASESKQMKQLSVKLQEKLASGDKESVEHATRAVHPEKESVVQSVSTSVQNTVVNLAASRMIMPTVGRAGGDVKLTSGGMWVQGLFNKSKQADAFNGYTRGIAAGADGTINKDWTIGAGYSFAHSDIDGTARNTEIDSNTVFLYGQYKPNAWYLNAVANYTWADYSEKGTVIDNTPIFADYSVNSFGGNVATGYDFKNGITPELGLRYIHISADDYTNSYGIKTHMDDADYMTGMLGARYVFNVFANKYTTFMPQLHATAKYDLLSDKHVATVTMPGIDSYAMDGERLNRFGGEFGIGLGVKYRNLDMSLNYDIDVRKDYSSQTGMLKFRCNF